MKEAIVHPDLKVEIINSPIPKPNAEQILIKVVYSGSNPKDWKRPQNMKQAHNSGDDIAGYVEAVGENVTEFKKGDRVAAFHQMMSPHGSFAEYAVAWAYTTFHLPKKTSFEEGATIPLAAMTAAVGLFNYRRLALPEPWKNNQAPIPLIVYGASGAVGSYAIKLAQKANIHPIIAVAGKGEAHVEKLISREKGDAIVDYRKGDEAVVSGIEEALAKAGAKEVKHAYDGVSEHNSYQNINQVLAKEGGRITLVLPAKDASGISKGVFQSLTMVGSVHGQGADGTDGDEAAGKDFGYVFFRYISRGLEDGWFTAHPYEVVPGGLGGVETGLNNLKAGKASAVKYIFKIEDTKA